MLKLLPRTTFHLDSATGEFKVEGGACQGKFVMLDNDDGVSFLLAEYNKRDNHKIILRTK